MADSVDPDQIALEQYDQGLHCLPVILIQKTKVNLKKGILKTTLSRCLSARKNACFFLDVPG